MTTPTQAYRAELAAYAEAIERSQMRLREPAEREILRIVGAPSPLPDAPDLGVEERLQIAIELFGADMVFSTLGRAAGVLAAQQELAEATEDLDA